MAIFQRERPTTTPDAHVKGNGHTPALGADLRPYHPSADDPTGNGNGSNGHNGANGHINRLESQTEGLAFPEEKSGKKTSFLRGFAQRFKNTVLRVEKARANLIDRISPETEEELAERLLAKRRQTLAGVKEMLNEDPRAYSQLEKYALRQVHELANQLFGSNLSNQTDIDWISVARHIHNEADKEVLEQGGNAFGRRSNAVRRFVAPNHAADLREALMRQGVNQALILLNINQDELQRRRVEDLFQQGTDGVLAENGNPVFVRDVHRIPDRFNGRDIRANLIHIIGMTQSARKANDFRYHRGEMTLDQYAQSLPLAILLTGSESKAFRDQFDADTVPLVFNFEDRRQPYWREYHPGGLHLKAIAR